VRFRILNRVTISCALFLGLSPLFAETLPSGAKITIRLDDEIRPTGKPGQHFSAPLAFPVFSDGQELVPLGSRIEGDVRGSKKTIFLSPRLLVLPDGRKIDFNAEISGINQKSLKTEENEGTIESKGSKADAAKQAGEIGTTGAAIGAMTTGSWEGMGIGAAAGVGAVLIGRKIAGRHDTTVIPAGTQITLNLIHSIDLPANMGPDKLPVDSISNREDRRPILRREDTPAQ